jgi:MFS family permease
MHYCVEPTSPKQLNPSWIHAALAAAVLAAAMGIGRFAYTPILPLMTAQAGLTAKAGATLATANYVGYLAGALAGTASSRVARSHLAIRSSLVLLVATLVAMPLGNSQSWIVMRLLAGFTSAVVFVGAVNWMADHLHHHSPHLTGWGFGGVGVGIALSGSLVLLLPGATGWKGAWWVAGGLAAVLSVGAWAMRARAGAASETPTTSADRPPASHRWFTALLLCYTLEGIGYIIAGTFIVAAIAHDSPGRLGSGAWIVVGVAAAPSAVLWSWLGRRFSHPVLLASALVLQAGGIVLPALVGGPAAALTGAILFGVTFIGISTVALAAGRHLRVPRAVAVLTAGYSVGQIAGPIAVAPLLHHGFRLALLVAAGVVLVAAAVAAFLRIGYPVQNLY